MEEGLAYNKHALDVFEVTIFDIDIGLVFAILVSAQEATWYAFASRVANYIEVNDNDKNFMYIYVEEMM